MKAKTNTRKNTIPKIPKIRVMKKVRNTLQDFIPFLCKEDAKFLTRTLFKSAFNLIILGLQLLTLYVTTR